MAKGFDWKAIKTEYITTDVSQQQLADKYGVSARHLSRMSVEEGWVEQRRRYVEKTVAKSVEKACERDSGRLAKLMDTTGMAVDVVTKAFEDAEQFNRYIVERREKYATPRPANDDPACEELLDERQWAEEQTFRKVDTKALKDMTAVLKDLTALMRDFYNIPTPAQAEAQRIAAERLELDRAKAEANGDGADRVEVVLTGDLAKWAK